MTYKHLIFGKFNIKEVQQAVSSSLWQEFRESLKGQSTGSKIKALEQWLVRCRQTKVSKIQVTNYVYALKRAGLVK